MAKTTTDLCSRVLSRIGTLATGDTPSAASLADITDYYNNVYQEYERLGVAFWDQDSIPEYVFEPLVDRIAAAKAFEEGWDGPDVAAADRRLRLMASELPSGEVLAPEWV